MTKPKVSEAQAQKLLEVVRYVLDHHEWCEMPMVRCEHGQHAVYCHHRGVGEPCEGCRMRDKAQTAAKWRADHA